MNSKLIPILLIVVGGTMIYAGIQKQNPLTILKSVLTNTAVPPVPTEDAPTNSNVPTEGAPTTPGG